MSVLRERDAASKCTYGRVYVQGAEQPAQHWNAKYLTEDVIQRHLPGDMKLLEVAFKTITVKKDEADPVDGSGSCSSIGAPKRARGDGGDDGMGGGGGDNTGGGGDGS